MGVLFGDGRIRAPVFFQLRPFFRAHVGVSCLTGVHFHRVDGGSGHQQKGQHTDGDDEQGEFRRLLPDEGA